MSEISPPQTGVPGRAGSTGSRPDGRANRSAPQENRKGMMTTGRSGRPSPGPFASYDHVSFSWRTWIGSPRGKIENSEEFSATWPYSGSMRNGVVSRLPLSEPPIGADEFSSSLLPTPAARDWKSSASNIMDRNSRPLNEVVGKLLPTPRTSDRFGPGVHGDGGMDLRTVVTLLPTPRASDGTKGGPNQRGSSGDLMLPSVAVLISTGESIPKPSGAGSTSSVRRCRRRR